MQAVFRPLVLGLALCSALAATAPDADAQGTVTHQVYANPADGPIGTIAFKNGFPIGPIAIFAVTIGGIECFGTMQLMSQGEHTACWEFHGCGVSGNMYFETGPFGTIGLILVDGGGLLWTSGP